MTDVLLYIFANILFLGAGLLVCVEEDKTNIQRGYQPDGKGDSIDNPPNRRSSES